MSDFQTEMDKRLRRICGIEDDRLPVFFDTLVETHVEWEGMSCEYTETNSSIRVWVMTEGSESWEYRNVVASAKAESLADLMRLLDAVELTDE